MAESEMDQVNHGIYIVNSNYSTLCIINERKGRRGGGVVGGGREWEWEWMGLPLLLLVGNDGDGLLMSLPLSICSKIL
jgi:hypothetical protein